VLKIKENSAKVEDTLTAPGGITIEDICELKGSLIRQALMRAVMEATEKSQSIRERLGMPA